MQLFKRNRRGLALASSANAASAGKPGSSSTPRGGLGSEIAGLASDIGEPLAAWLGLRVNRDPLLDYQQPDSAYAWPYGLFEEALDKDAHLFAILAQRKAAVLSWQLSVVAADESPEALACAALVEHAISRISGGSGFARDLSELLDALAFGFAVSEVIWEPADYEAAQASQLSSPHPRAGAASVLLPRALLARHPRRFVFSAKDEPRLLTQREPFAGEPLPPRKFIVFAPYGRYENPYGYPLLRCVWWLAWFKRQVLRYWVMFCEKHGSPTAVLQYPAGATEKDKRAYKRIIASIQQETGLVIPEGVTLSLLEAQRAGSSAAYSELIELCNREMSKALLGQTLTTEPGERGARSLGEVHQAVRADIVKQDAEALAAALTEQLARWIVELNFAPALQRFPRVELRPPEERDLRLQLEIDRFFAEQGLALDQLELYERYGRGRPEKTS